MLVQNSKAEFRVEARLFQLYFYNPYFLCNLGARKSTCMKALFLPPRFFQSAGVVIALLALSYGLPWLFWPAKIALGLFLGLVGVEGFFLFRYPLSGFEATREMREKLSLGDDNLVRVQLHHPAQRTLSGVFVDELPKQLQERDFQIPFVLEAGENLVLEYYITPKTRGAYTFEKMHFFLNGPFLKLIQRRISLDYLQEAAVYPSILQMKKFELATLKNLATFYGIRKMRRIGHSYEFDQIKTYVRGDDYRGINWKATSRHNQLMVNHYEDERSQQVYCVLDMGRAMEQPFEGLTLLDYAINTSLVISNLALKKEDRVGLISFSENLRTNIPADKRPDQLRRLLEGLYRQKTGFLEANFDSLFQFVNRKISRRSLLMLFTNFESESALRRVMPLLRRLARKHLLVVVFFENTELLPSQDAKPAADLKQVYERGIMRNFVLQKQKMVRELKQHGIEAVLTPPEELSVRAINKYLELKARGKI